MPALDRTPLDIATVRLLFPSLFGSSDLRVGGEVRGLEGSGLRLELKVSESSSSESAERLERDITGNGNFTFNKSFTKDHSFAVQILSQAYAMYPL
ncbi:MAG: hypothetical protein JJT78_11895 [Leptospira sp.]|nr:hypothetical protein [Leptospira sp.]